MNYNMDPNEMMVCPYDSAHRVSRQRMQYHIVKCQKVRVIYPSTTTILSFLQNHETANFKVCPFNAQHIVPNSKFSYHLKICPDQVSQFLMLGMLIHFLLKVRMQLEVYHGE